MYGYHGSDCTRCAKQARFKGAACVKLAGRNRGTQLSLRLLCDVLLHPALHCSDDVMALSHVARREAYSDLGRDQFAFSLRRGYQFAVSRSCNGGERFATQARVRSIMLSLFRDHDPMPSKAPPAALDPVEYIVRPSDDIWLIEHAGGRYGPYKNSREAMLFAIDAARKLGELGRNTRVRMTDEAGHALTTWNYGVDPNPAIF
jgi:hypothetical protein